MTWHILGWLVVASQIGVAGVVMRSLSIASHESRTWMRRLRVPKASSAPLSLSSGSDYVGVV